MRPQMNGMEWQEGECESFVVLDSSFAFRKVN